MSTTTRFLAKISDGKLDYYDPTAIRQRVAKLNNFEVWITIVKKSKARSDNQNRYYWGVVIKILAQELGYMEEEIHDTLKAKFLTDRTGKIEIVRSTASLATIDFENYLSAVRMWASSELNIYISQPNEVPFDY